MRKATLPDSTTRCQQCRSPTSQVARWSRTMQRLRQDFRFSRYHLPNDVISRQGRNVNPSQCAFLLHPLCVKTPPENRVPALRDIAPCCGIWRPYSAVNNKLYMRSKDWDWRQKQMFWQLSFNVFLCADETTFKATRFPRTVGVTLRGRPHAHVRATHRLFDQFLQSTSSPPVQHVMIVYWHLLRSCYPTCSNGVKEIWEMRIVFVFWLKQSVL